MEESTINCICYGCTFARCTWISWHRKIGTCGFRLFSTSSRSRQRTMQRVCSSCCTLPSTATSVLLSLLVTRGVSLFFFSTGDSHYSFLLTEDNASMFLFCFKALADVLVRLENKSVLKNVSFSDLFEAITSKFSPPIQDLPSHYCFL